MHCHHVKHPWHLFIEGAGPAGAEYCLPLIDNFSLDKEITECRMYRVCGG